MGGRRHQKGILVEQACNIEETKPELNFTKEQKRDFFELKPIFNEKWFELTYFEKVDAAKVDRYFFKHENGDLLG